MREGAAPWGHPVVPNHPAHQPCRRPPFRHQPFPSPATRPDQPTRHPRAVGARTLPCRPCRRSIAFRRRPLHRCRLRDRHRQRLRTRRAGPATKGPASSSPWNTANAAPDSTFCRRCPSRNCFRISRRNWVYSTPRSCTEATGCCGRTRRPSAAPPPSPSSPSVTGTNSGCRSTRLTIRIGCMTMWSRRSPIRCRAPIIRGPTRTRH